MRLSFDSEHPGDRFAVTSSSVGPNPLSNDGRSQIAAGLRSCVRILAITLLASTLVAAGQGKGNGGKGGGNGGGKGGGGKNAGGPATPAGATPPAEKPSSGQAAPKPPGTVAPSGFPKPNAPEMPPGVTPHQDKQDARELFGKNELEDPDLITDEHLLWGVRLDSSARDRVITDATRIYAVTAAGTAYALEGSTGDLVWSSRVGRAASARPTLAGDRLVFPVVSGELISLDIATGAQRAAIRSPGTVVDPIVSDGALIAFSTKEGSCCVCDPRILKVEASYRGIPGIALTAPTFAGENVLVADARGKIICFGRDDGRVNWEKSVTGAIELPPLHLAQAEGIVVVGTNSGRVTAFEIGSGAEKWRFVGSGAFQGGLAVASDVLLTFASARAPLLAAATGTVKREWLFSAPPAAAPMATAGGTLVVQPGGKLETYDGLGRLRYSIEFQTVGLGVVAGIQGQGIAVVATDDAGLYRIQDR